MAGEAGQAELPQALPDAGKGTQMIGGTGEVPIAPSPMGGVAEAPIAEPKRSVLANVLAGLKKLLPHKKATEAVVPPLSGMPSPTEISSLNPTETAAPIPTPAEPVKDAA